MHSRILYLQTFPFHLKASPTPTSFGSFPQNIKSVECIDIFNCFIDKKVFKKMMVCDNKKIKFYMNWLLDDLPINENNTRVLICFNYFAIYFLNKVFT